MSNRVVPQDGIPLRGKKVNSLLEHELSKIILRDFAFSSDALVTLTRVDVTANLIEAKAYVSVFFARKMLGEGESEAKADRIVKMFNNNIFDIQQKINKTLKMRPVPKIIFVKETEISKAAKIEEILVKAKVDTKD